MKVSDWVYTVHNKNKITGFITEINNKKATIFVTIPINYGEIIVSKNIILKSSILLHLDDLPTLIDLSLSIKDKAWFNKLVNERKLWNRPEKIRGMVWCDD
ncbi:hypothetical protein PP175_10645 [Aneurinibacillus sp. Ricciae_BoGa-3]|uniref:hypothetical protein n=1 Tax=Aneurinibacillus sp. Ricciae_BoGa-3 TaxID=3022697 RepID=UPI0023424084|nr:hypothetical protein [Aneurinibacillus sp. Ricciae_BoGa-3]WCK56326.1 hypothetical protein PP175_10645 [Aneurinibacillus sp. Ricciae_BoGa-3]